MDMAQQSIQISEKKKEIQRKSKSSFDLTHIINHYAPYVYIWVCRVLCVVMAYLYHSSAGFIALTWVLFTFLIPLVEFVKFTIYVFTPLMTFVLFYLYTINIPGVFLDPGKYESDMHLFTGEYGIVFEYPEVEVFLFIITIVFLILLIPSRKILKLQRDEMRIAIFTYLSNKETNFLMQMSFYIMKRIHILVLLLIFIYGFQKINIYYIGIMFFFIIYASSL